MLGAALEGHLWPWVLSHLRSLTPSLEARVPEGGEEAEREDKEENQEIIVITVILCVIMLLSLIYYF